MGSDLENFSNSEKKENNWNKLLKFSRSDPIGTFYFRENSFKIRSKKRAEKCLLLKL
jgi:hypothetical protein